MRPTMRPRDTRPRDTRSRDMKPRDPFFFIGILPSRVLQREITEFKQYICDTWGPSHAFKSPPHLTIHPPFGWPERRLPPLYRSLQEFTATQAPFQVHLKDFGAFPPKVLFIQPLENEALNALFQGLMTHLEKSLEFVDDRNHHPFHPHVTIAHRDVEERDFPAIWRYFQDKTYERTFDVQALTLLESVNNRWMVKETFTFGGG